MVKVTSSDAPLIREIVPIKVLRWEYENGSPNFLKQIDHLESLGWKGIRRVRGDGDCFYRGMHCFDPLASCGSRQFLLLFSRVPVALAYAWCEKLLAPSRKQVVNVARARAE